jgi:hypothetical protein
VKKLKVLQELPKCDTDTKREHVGRKALIQTEFLQTFYLFVGNPIAAKHNIRSTIKTKDTVVPISSRVEFKSLP